MNILCVYIISIACHRLACSAFTSSSKLSVQRRFNLSVKKSTLRPIRRSPCVVAVPPSSHVTNACIEHREEKTILSLSFSDPDSNSEAQEILAARYRKTSYVFLATFLVLLLSPNRIQTMAQGTKVGGAAGYGIAAGVCHILNVATDHDRLESDTYKRLNVGLLLFSFLGLFALPAEASFHPNLSGALLTSVGMTVSKVLGGIVAYTGWKRGVYGWPSPEPLNIHKSPGLNEMMHELADGSKKTWSELRTENKAATIYKTLFVVICGVCVSSNILSFFHALKNGKSAFETSLYVSAIARLSFISTIVHTLKQAAERNRLTGTTFIQLNGLLGVWSLAVGIGQGYVNSVYSIRGSINMFILSTIFFVKAFLSIKEKDEDIKLK